jgi:prepilin-type N-terminal cleavage/methylation domain-containing protein
MMNSERNRIAVDGSSRKTSPLAIRHLLFRYRRGFTLLEALIAVTILLVLTGIVVVGGKAVRDARRRSTAEQQIAMIAQAIDQYAAFWPKWKVGGVVVAEKGWPDYIAGHLFETGTFEVITGFNDHLTFGMEGGILRVSEGHDVVGLGDVLSANICLAYSLTAGSGKGPYVPADDNALLKDVTDPVLLEGFRKTDDAGAVLANPLLPGYVGGPSAARHAQVLVDPWGSPYRYFWVYRGSSAYRGYLPVETADVADADFRTAVGFVLESAGPNRKFGNVWKIDPLTPEYRDAADNFTVTP